LIWKTKNFFLFLLRKTKHKPKTKKSFFIINSSQIP